MQGIMRFFLTGVFTGVLAFTAHAQDASEVLLRLNRMENQMRQLSGELEQLHFENKRLQDQLLKFQQDVEFRFQDSAGKAGSGAKPAPTQKKSDAYDPTQPVGDGGQGKAAQGGPLNLNQAARGAAPAASAPAATAPVPFAVASSPPASTGSIAPSKPQNTYAEGYGLMQQKKYAEAESVLRAFMQAHPKDSKIPDATYWLGESYLRRTQYAGAAEQFLKIYQSYPKAGIASEGLFKLALSLKGLNQKPQACATLAEWGRRYPSGDKNLKTQVEQESKKLAC